MIKNIITRIQASDPAQRRSGGNIFKFLAVLLALTLVARGTSGATLARVTLATPERSEIVDAITGSATVSATDTIDIQAPAGLKVAEMLVSVGQQVSAGDAVAVFDLDNLQDIHMRETATLRRLELDLERLERAETVDASSLENAQRTLARAQEDYHATAQQGEADIAEARETLDKLLAAYGAAADAPPAAILNHQRVLEDFYATLAAGEADIAAAEAALRDMTADDAQLQTAIRSHQRAQEDYNATYAQGAADIAAAQTALAEAQTHTPDAADRSAIDNAQRNLQRARDDHNTTRRQGEDNIWNAEQALNTAVFNYQEAVLSSQLDPNPGAVAAARTALEQAQNAVANAQNAAEANLLASSRRVEDAEISLAAAQQNFGSQTAGEAERTADDIERAAAALETAENRAADNLQTAARRLEDAEISLEQARRGFENSQTAETERLKNALETARNRAADNLQTAQRRLDDAAVNVSAEVERAQNALQTAINRAANDRQQAARRVEDAAAQLDSAGQTHGRSAQQAADTAAQNMINASTVTLDITAQENTLRDLDALLATNGVLYSQESGAVSFAAEAGGTTGSGNLVTLRDTAGGFEAAMQMPREDGERLAIGSESQVTTTGGSMFFTPTVTGVVSGISQPDEQDRVTVTIRLPEGDWTAGQRVDVLVLFSRANYDMTVPVSALHSDNSGYFLLVMEPRSTVLGLQNVVERVNVTIVAADDDMASVRGAVGRDSMVITGSNKAVSVGDRVRAG